MGDREETDRPAGFNFKWFILCLVALTGVAAGFAVDVVLRIWREEAVDAASLVLEPSVVVTDRNGALLRVVPDDDGERTLPVRLADVPVDVRNAFVIAEDRRFRAHPGFDILAIARAVKDAAVGGRFVSGASTITQQVARLTHPRERSFSGKFREIVRAVRIERTLSKDRILEEYLNRVPLGRNVLGVGAASRAYFGKGVGELSAAEGALLAALARAPGRFDPYGERRGALRARRDRILSRMADLSLLTPAEAARARNAGAATVRFGLPFRAPHFVDRVLAETGGSSLRIETSIDLAVQTIVEEALRANIARVGEREARQGAAIVVRNETREILAYVGSVSFSARDSGFCDGVRMRRSAGSTLKPFLYARAIEAGVAPRLIDDTARRYRAPQGDFVPDNFDRVAYGPVSMRVALANSLNLSAVATLGRVGVEPFRRTLSDLSLLGPDGPRANDSGLGLAVGNAEVTLEGLARAYAALASGGTWAPLRFVRSCEGPGVPPGPHRRVFFPETSFLVMNILSDPAARIVAFGAGFPGNPDFPIALKTGTSSHYRDAWAVACTPTHTAVVWVGNFDGSATANVSGGWAAAPVAVKILKTLQDGRPPRSFPRPPGVASVPVCGISGMRPGAGCEHVAREWFYQGGDPQEECTLHVPSANVHRLPARYARWAADRTRRGASGRFVLADGAQLSAFDPFPVGAEGAGEPPGVVIRSGEPSAVVDLPPASQAPPPEPPDRARLTAGSSEESAGSTSDPDTRVEIAYPLPRDRFVLERGVPPPSIRFDAVVTGTVPYVDWFVDGKHYARVPPPYSVYWPLGSGSHRVAVSAPGFSGDAVPFIVQ